MPGAFVTIEGSLDGVLARLAALESVNLAADGLANIGGLIESQTRGRFQSRTAPDGTAWPAWSKRYAATRRKGQSLLVAEGHLRDSIAWDIERDNLRVGSNLVYAAVHQLGSTKESGRGSGIPAREYLGLSDADVAEIKDAMGAWLDGVLQ